MKKVLLSLAVAALATTGLQARPFGVTADAQHVKGPVVTHHGRRAAAEGNFASLKPAHGLNVVMAAQSALQAFMKNQKSLQTKDAQALLFNLHQLTSGSIGFARLDDATAKDIFAGVQSTLTNLATRYPHEHKAVAHKFIQSLSSLIAMANFGVSTITNIEVANVISGLINEINALVAKLKMHKLEKEFQGLIFNLLRPLQNLIFDLNIPKDAFQKLISTRIQNLDPVLQGLLFNLDFPGKFHTLQESIYQGLGPVHQGDIIDLGPVLN